MSRNGTNGSEWSGRGQESRRGQRGSRWVENPGQNSQNQNGSGSRSSRAEECQPGPSGSRNGKRRREPSPEPVPETFPPLRISSNIFERDPGEGRQGNQDEDTKDLREETKRKVDKVDKVEGGDGNATEDQQNLLNFFGFTDRSKQLPSVAPQRNVGEVGAPVPKLPRVAHYNAHTEDEVRYVEQLRPLYEQAIPDHESDTESDDETPAPLRARMHLRDAIFDKYDFKQRSVDVTKLAAYERKDTIVKAIEENRVVIIDGYTGCGKTTQVPQLIIDRAVELRRPCNVIVTQPRKLAAVSVARRVCEERCWELGTVVGYQVGMDRKISNDTLVTYMTTGVLLQKLVRMRSLRSWTHIIVDEVHERDLHTDLLLLFIKKILTEDTEGRERHVKLILMSATVNARQFSEYFAVHRGDDEIGETPVVKIPTLRKFKVEDFYLDDLVSSTEELDRIYGEIDLKRASLIPELYEQAARTIIGLDKDESAFDPRLRNAPDSKMIQKERGSVLVFLPGMLEIKEMQKILNHKSRERVQKEQCNDPNPFGWEVVPLHSSITNDEQRKVFMTPRPYMRKIILSTNIAESSITVPDIVYVIDFCLTKSNYVDAQTNFSCLRVCWASVSQCIQRAGRTGRVRDGKVYRMIPRGTFGRLDQDATPDMLKSALEYVVLQVKTLNMGSPKEILCLALDPPEVSGIERAISNLKEVGAMTVMTTVDNHLIYSTCDGDVTFMGEIMTALPLSPQLARLIMLGHCFGVMKEAIIIAAGLSGKSPFSTPYSKQLESYLQKLNWAKKSYSDCLAILHAYRAWYRQFAETDDYLGAGRVKNSHERNWARAQNIQLTQMREIRSMVMDIEERLKEKRLVPYTYPVEYSMESNTLPKEIALMLKIAIAGAFYPNYFHRQRPDVANYERERSKEVSGQDLFSTVYFKGFPLGNDGRLYAQHIADFLSHGLSVPYIKFEGQKVLAIFDASGKKIGPICEGVYRAIKKRMIRDNLTFNILWKEDEQRELRSYEETRARRQFLRCPAQIYLPGVDRASIDVYVMHVESPSQFWIVYRHLYGKHAEIFEKINKTANPELRGSFNPRRVFVGGLVLAPFIDENRQKYFYRGRIQAPMNPLGNCLIYFIDYGNSEWISVEDLQEIPPSLIQLDFNTVPGLAVECRLCLLKPAIVHGSVWAEAAVEQFKKYVTNPDEEYLQFQIHCIDKSVISGTLLSKQGVSSSQRFNFNKWLEDKGFADQAPEPYTANLNFKARERFELMRNDREQIEGCNRQQLAEPKDRDFMPPSRDGTVPCTLKGPWSPLELQFQPLCQSSSSKQVNIDNHSVNCVTLDHEPTAPTTRLLVASTITIQERSGAVVARETTIMPAIPGMLSLMSLIFAPRAEMRCDRRFHHYTGALCGLGTDDMNEPIYMDHDMELVFDTEIDDDDIDRINYIRYCMNVVLRKNRGQNNAPVHKNLCETLIRLLKKVRRRVNEDIYPQESYVWNRIPPSHILSARRRDFEVLPLDIFLPHDKIRLTAEDETIESFDFAV